MEAALSRQLMSTLELNVVVSCPVETVFAVYTDIERWRDRGIFGNISWRKGRPWEEGSILKVTTRVLVPTTFDQVLVHFERNRYVAFVSNLYGVSCETRVEFTPLTDATTAVHVTLVVGGTALRHLGFALEPVMEKATREFFEDLKQECAASPAAAAKP
jgi:Polyketide cyclase / dehydrase and lipid transport